MGFRINTNVGALNAHNAAVMNNRQIDSSLAKLSSGLRINTAADDASGLTIADSLRSQASSLGQAISNGNDAIGLIQTADGALSEYGNILDTIKTKATQAASDTQNTASRQAIQKDIDALMKELNTIANTTSFNGQKLLSGTYTNKEFQMGANANESVKLNIASAQTSQIGQTTTSELDIKQLGDNQLTLKSAITGQSITLASVNIQNNNNTANGLGALADEMNAHSGETGISAKAVVQATTGAITAGTTGSDFAINGVNIGAINVSANDSNGTLLNAINAQTSQTGVTATATTDGKIQLTTDGRGLSVTGDTSLLGASTQDLTTMGHLNVTQAGSSTFQIAGAGLGAAVGADITVTGSMTTIQDSILAIGSTISSGSTLAAGSTLGVVITATAGMAMTANSSTADYNLAVGSVLAQSSVISKGTTLASTINVGINSINVLSSDMLVKAGSLLASGTVLDAGTTLNQDISANGVSYKAGTVLNSDVTLTSAGVTLSQDMVMHTDANTANRNASIATGSSLLAGSILGANITITGTSTLAGSMDLKSGSIIATGSTMAVGTVVGQDITVTGSNHTTTAVTDMKVGSTLVSASVVKEASTIGGQLTTNAAMTLKEDMVVKAGSMLATGTTLKAGTVLNQDLTDTQVGGGAGSGLKAGTVLGTDVTTTASIYLANDMTLKKDSSIAQYSYFTANGGDQNSVQLSNNKFSNLSNIDVTTLDGAMKAIDTVSAAITNLDTIRSGLGSAQNQVTSTINNISTTQVNVQAAESNIRDVDFAAESANFSKHNILAQSGSYAMSQANAVQQNVLKLLQ
ncbi:MAG: flagellin [Thiovulaceae bacterium]|nr:flagellin [Sulfurimonadaceae bacterium]